MRRLNYDISVGRAYRKYHPGATPSELAHYCLPTLINDKPDVVVIHAGTISYFNDDIHTIANEIFNLVKVCQSHGVNDIFVSGLTFRNRHLTKVRELNNNLNKSKSLYGFIFINNDNILAQDICKDDLHLNYTGTVKIAINITEALNTFLTT